LQRYGTVTELMNLATVDKTVHRKAQLEDTIYSCIVACRPNPWYVKLHEFTKHIIRSAVGYYFWYSVYFDF